MYLVSFFSVPVRNGVHTAGLPLKGLGSDPGTAKDPEQWGDGGGGGAVFTEKQLPGETLVCIFSVLEVSES